MYQKCHQRRKFNNTDYNYIDDNIMIMIIVMIMIIIITIILIIKK